MNIIFQMVCIVIGTAVSIIAIYYIGVAFIKILKVLTKSFFCILFNYKYDTINKISKKTCNLHDALLTLDEKMYFQNKKDILLFVDQEYPIYKVPNFHNLEFYKKELPHLYETFKRQNEEYPKIVSNIYMELMKFDKTLKEHMQLKLDEFYDNNIAKPNM